MRRSETSTHVNGPCCANTMALNCGSRHNRHDMGQPNKENVCQRAHIFVAVCVSFYSHLGQLFKKIMSKFKEINDPCHVEPHASLKWTSTTPGMSWVGPNPFSDMLGHARDMSFRAELQNKAWMAIYNKLTSLSRFKFFSKLNRIYFPS
jgi:hypothetical protein